MPRLQAEGKALRKCSTTLWLAVLLAACASQEARSSTAPGPRAARPSATVAPVPPPVGSPPRVNRSEPTLLITELAVLAELERRGLTLGEVLTGEAARDNARLSQLPGFAPLVRELESELRRVALTDKLAGVDVARYSHRLFDARFLRSSEATFTLIGVVSRPDRAPFHPDSCGETRLVYRLRYSKGAERASKLPLTIGVELRVDQVDGGCRVPSARWLEPGHATAEARAAWLRTEGPLAASVLDTDARVVLNVQLVRWPSTVRPDLGGHAEYLLRAFRFDDARRLQVERLENTLSPAAVASPTQRRELEAWIAQSLPELDRGTAVLPEQFRAERAISVTPRGLNRLANRPFTAALAQSVGAERDLSRGTFVRSAAGLLRRLDQLSCQGCHEARSVAGFHLLGEDGPDAPDENALATPISPLVGAELPRRLRIARSMLNGEEPDFAAPLPERASARGGYGEHCALTDDPSFTRWTCDDGLVCSAVEAVDGEPVGQCLPRVREVGDACETGGVVAYPNPHRDRMQRVKVEECPDMVCNRSAVGFPAGMCTAACGAPGATCGAIAILDSFNACLARGESFLACVRGNSRASGLRPCSADSPCRDDYVCARTQSGGVCIPPYFVFQLRVDGH